MSDATISSSSLGRSLRAVASTPLARSVIAGVVVWVFSILFYLSYTALIFSGPLTPSLAYGLAATLVTGAIGGAVVSLRSSLPFQIGGPDGATSAVTAALVAALVARLAPQMSDELLTTALMVLALSSALTGLVLCGLGLARAARAVRFIPYPVIGGFLAASGCLMLTGAVEVLTGIRPRWADVGLFLDTVSLEKLVAAAAVAVFLVAGRRYWKTPLAMPLQLLAAIGLFHAVLWIAGIRLADAQQLGWTFFAPAKVMLTPPWSLDVAHVPWSALPELAADFFAVVFVTAVNLLLNVTGIEFSTKYEADLDRELLAVGSANLLCAAFGGYVACVTGTRTGLNFALGATSRVAGLVVAALSGAALFVDPNFLAYVPKCMLGGFLLVLSYDTMARWLVGTRRRLAPLEYVSLVAIAFIIVWWGFIPGVFIGVIFGCATFALNAGRVNAIKFAFDGSEYRSRLDRGQLELALLRQHGRELQGLQLQSYLFFGSANKLFQDVKSLLTACPQCRFLLFDFKLVTGLDSSATHSFTQIKQAADAIGARLVLVNLNPALSKTLRDIRLIDADVLIFSDLDRALEVCESAIIGAHIDGDRETRTLRDWLAEALGDAAHAEALAQECRRREFAAGEVVARENTPADCMHFILEGRIGIVVTVEGGREVRVRSLGSHTIIGEMGLLTGRPRSATMQAEIASVAYELPAASFERLKSERPDLALALYGYVIDLMAERLSFASRVIGVLQR